MRLNGVGRRLIYGTQLGEIGPSLALIDSWLLISRHAFHLADQLVKLLLGMCLLVLHNHFLDQIDSILSTQAVQKITTKRLVE